MKDFDFYDFFSYVALIISVLFAFFVNPLLGIASLFFVLYHTL